MLKFSNCIIFSVLLFPFSSFCQTSNLCQYVNPLIGTKGWLFHGRTTPFVTPPFGNTHWTACTRNSRIAVLNYKFKDSQIRGFRGSHKPAMWMGDYGFVTLKPSTGAANSKLMKNYLRFSHSDEVAKPYFYAVKATTKNRNSILTEMTATETCGFLNFKFSNGSDPIIYLEASQDMLGQIELDTVRNIVSGFNTDRQSAHLGPPLPQFKGYFQIYFNQKVASYGTWQGDSLFPNRHYQSGQNCGLWVKFKPGTFLVNVAVATSFISLEQAAQNLAFETNRNIWDFEALKQKTKANWEKHLSRLQIEGGSQSQREIFYSAMYHSLLFPRKFSEYGRYYSAFDDRVHTGVSFNDYSLWDTYRAQHPLLHFTAREYVGPMVQSLLQMYREGGYMPKWPNPSYTGIMIGTHADAVVADAMVKGIKDFDYDLAYSACLKDATVPPDGDSIKRWADRALWTTPEARAGLYWVKKLGFVPIDKTNESVSNCLEASFDDYCVAQVANITGHKPEFEFLLRQSQNYRNVFNPKTGMMAPRNSDGTWYHKPRKGFTEGGPWTYLFGVQHDIRGLIDLMGGEEKFVRKLDINFRGIRYWHENEPGHHYTYLYDYTQKAWKTQKQVAKYRRLKYHNTPKGLTGDDDCGQMSAWYIFSSLGFYPVCPGSTSYAIGTPLFPSVKISPFADNPEVVLEIRAKQVSAKKYYIQKVKFNGRVLESPFLEHFDLMKGGILEFEMGDKPNKIWGTNE